MPLSKKKYTYVGPVTQFGKCIALKWSGETIAVSSKKARSNLAYQFKKNVGLTSSAGSLDFPGLFYEEEL